MMKIETYGEGGYDPKAANKNLVSSKDANLSTEEANSITLQQRVDAALGANRTFLSKQSPTNAEVVAQVKLLTREASALIRFLLNRFEDTE